MKDIDVNIPNGYRLEFFNKEGTEIKLSNPTLVEMEELVKDIRTYLEHENSMAIKFVGKIKENSGITIRQYGEKKVTRIDSFCESIKSELLKKLTNVEMKYNFSEGTHSMYFEKAV